MEHLNTLECLTIIQKLQIRRLKTDNSKCYYEDLQDMASERNKKRQVERAKERELSFDVSNNSLQTTKIACLTRLSV